METYQRINTVCLFTLTIIAVAFILAFTKTVMIPFVLSVFLYLILTPFMRWLQMRFKLQRWLAMGITLGLFVGGIIVVALLISSSIDSFVSGLDQYKERVDNLVLYVEESAAKLGYDITAFKLSSNPSLAPILPTLRKLTTSVLGILSNSILVIIFTLFLLTGEAAQTQFNSTIEKIKNSIARYVSTKLAVSLATGGVSYLVFLAFNVELASMFAILTVLLNFIPNIGSIFAVMLPIPVILLQYFFGWQTFLILILLTMFQMLIGNFLEPKIMGKSMGIHPVAILLALTFWGFIWGIPGMFLSVPIMATLKIIAESFEFTAPMARWMEGKLV